MEKLTITLIKKEDPFEDNPYELWGDLIIKYDNQIIIKIQWDLLGFVQEFIENKEHLKTDTFPYQYTDNLEKSSNVILQNIDDEDDELLDKWLDEFDNYYPYHIYHIDGTETPWFYIGLNPNGIGEISWETGDAYYMDIENLDGSVTEMQYDETSPEYYKYEFDMEASVAQFDAEIISFLGTFTITDDKVLTFFKEELPEYYQYMQLENKN